MEDNSNHEIASPLSSISEGKGSILLSTGEASGDAVAGALLSELRKLGFMGKAYAIGGRWLSHAGASLIADSTQWGAIGVARSFLVAPKVLAGYIHIKNWLARTRPAVVIGVDFGPFNVRLLRYAKQLGIKTLYFMPPGSWRRDFQGKHLSEVADVIATPFPWSAELLRSSGARVHWVGHPILQMVGEAGEGERDGLAILPGSRSHEVANNLPVIARALQLLEEARTMQIFVVAASTVKPETLKYLWMKAWGEKYPFIEKDLPCIVPSPPYDVLKRSCAGIICSGTATLESALCECPMVVVYRGDFLMKLEYLLRRPKLKYVALPNVILNRKVLPELIQNEATPENIAHHLRPLLTATYARAEQLSAFQELRKVLGPQDALIRCAKLVMELLSDDVDM